MNKTMPAFLMLLILSACSENKDSNSPKIIEDTANPFDEIIIVKTIAEKQIELIPVLIKNIKLNSEYIPDDFFTVRYKDKHRFRKLIDIFEIFEVSPTGETDSLRRLFPKGGIEEDGTFYFEVDECPDKTFDIYVCDDETIEVTVF